MMTEGRPLLHYAHESARYQVDVAKLRKQKHRLETMLRDIQRAAAEERVSLSQKVTDLQQQVDRLCMPLLLISLFNSSRSSMCEEVE